jgi:L-fuconolactonase
LVTEADHRAWTVAQLELYITHLLETFGPRRLLFGGDWPVAKLASDYRRWLGVARTVTSRLFPADQVAILHDNAARVYRIT